MPLRPVGVFDSGVGGLSVLRHVRTLLPGDDLIYVADSAHAPYGEKSVEYILARAGAIARFLLAQNVKALVVACNTATAAAVEALRAEHPRLPIVGVEPGVKPAIAATATGVVGVLATPRTVASGRFTALVERHRGNATVRIQACPGLAEAIERGEVDTPATRALVERYVAPLVAQRVDTLVLGCTHYPFITALIRQVAGPGVTIVDTGEAVARQLLRRLDEANLARRGGEGGERFWSSGDAAHVGAVLERLWMRAAPVLPLTE